MTLDSPSAGPASAILPLATGHIPDDFVPRFHEGFIVDRCDDAGNPGGPHVILLHPTRAAWAVTNETGLMLSGLCDGTRTVVQIATELAALYALPDAAPVAADVKAFLADALKALLLEQAPDGSQPQPVGPAPVTVNHPRYTRELALFLTEECNLRCKHCFVVEGKMPSDSLSRHEVAKLVEEHVRLNPVTSVTFSGGEISLVPDWLDMVEHACQRANHVLVCTNALLLTEADARRLAASGAMVQVSLDGPDPEIHDYVRGKGSFAKTWAAIEMLAGIKPSMVALSCTLTRSVLGHVEALVEAASRAGVSVVRFIPLLRQRAALTHWDVMAPDPQEVMATYRFLMFELPRRRPAGATSIKCGFPGFVPNLHPDGAWCPLGRMTLIDSRGSAYNCPSMNIPEYRVGSIRENSLEELQQGARNEELRRKVVERRWTVPECAACAWRNFCQGSCTALSYMRTNEFYATDEYCDFRRELYRRNALAKAGLISDRPTDQAASC